MAVIYATFEFFPGILLATAKDAYVTTMIILHLILLSAVHIYDLYTAISRKVVG